MSKGQSSAVPAADFYASDLIELDLKIQIISFAKMWDWYSFQ